MKSLTLSKMSKIEGGLDAKKCRQAERLWRFGWSIGNYALIAAANQMAIAFCGRPFEGGEW